MKKAIFKVPNGKLLKIFLEDFDGKIKSIKITGDFFAHPEENIEKMERALAGADLNSDSLKNKLHDFIQKSPTQLFGLDIDYLVSTILTAS